MLSRTYYQELWVVEEMNYLGLGGSGSRCYEQLQSIDSSLTVWKFIWSSDGIYPKKL